MGLDLGTATILVYVAGRGIVVREPSMLAIDRGTGEVIAIGEKARQMLGRTPGNIVALRPLKDRVIADFDSTEKIIRYFIERVQGASIWKRSRMVICTPAQITGVEERAVRQAALQAGARQVFMIEEPIAAALGAGLDISAPQASMVMDIGGGTTDVAVLSLGGIVCSASLKVAGDKMDEAIIRYVRREHNPLIGEKTGEELKKTIGTAHPSCRWQSSMEVRGRDVVSGLPRTVKISAPEVFEALQEPLQQIVGAIREVLEKTPPELSADLVDKGMVLTGGGSLLAGIDTLLAEETGLPVYIAEDPVSCVALGTGKALAMMDILAKRARVDQNRP